MKKTFLVFLLILSFFSTLQFLSAQSEDENVFLPVASEPLQNTQSEDQNVYLDQPKQKNSEADLTQSPAQISNGKLTGVYEGTILSCPYSFERDLSVGMKGEDVRLLQVLLNSDRRTIISVSGAGSPGKETTTFGQATNVALKKFQALFIEYIGVANGRFGPRTRTVMNAICNNIQAGAKPNENIYNTVQGVQKDATPEGEITEIPNDKIPPRISLSSNLSAVEKGNTFKVVANFSEEVKSFTPDSVIVDNAVVKEIRKLSKLTFAMTITPDENAKEVMVQVEADRVQDLAGNLNENASNEVKVRVIASRQTAQNTANPDLSELENLVGKITNSAPNCNYDQFGRLIQVNPTTGTPFNTSGCSQTGQQNTYAQFDSTRGCYSDNGQLPPGIQEIQRCSNPNNPNNPYNPNNPNNPTSPCNSAYQQQLIYQQQQMSSYYGYSVPIQNPCQNASVVAQTNQAAQQAAAQRAQAQQAQGIGQILGNLFRGNSSGNQGNNPYPNQDPRGQQYQQQSPDTSTKPPTTTEEKSISLEGNYSQLKQRYDEKCTSEGETPDVSVQCNALAGKLNQIEEETIGSKSTSCGGLIGEAAIRNCEEIKKAGETSGSSPQATEASQILRGEVVENMDDTSKECKFLKDGNQKIKYNANRFYSILINDGTKQLKYILAQQSSGLFGSPKFGAFKGEIFLQDSNKTKGKIKMSELTCCKTYKKDPGQSQIYTCTEEGKYSKLQVYEVDSKLTKEDLKIGKDGTQ